ncbi:hypothetical protein RJ640_011485, partial [Escallonia rubra]
STVHPTKANVLNKLVSKLEARILGNSFRIEIGSISQRRAPSESGWRSYSFGSFDYIVDEGYEVSVGSIHRRGASDCTEKDSAGAPVSQPELLGEILAAKVAGRRSWLRDYVDRISAISFSSHAMSFRSSGRFFTGSSRRSENVVVAAVEDVEELKYLGEAKSTLPSPYLKYRHTHLPHLRTVATEAKLSSKITISELCFATSVPWIPIESPISASLRAVNVTANGSPSGIATTTMVTAAATIPTTALMISSTLVLLPLNSVLPFSSSVFPVKYRINKTRRTRKATAKPTFPIDEVSLLSRACRGVCSSVSRLIVLIISPHIVFIPTEVTSILA